ncbi:hypothetical protein [Falsiphaeobacter marinintestinus]|uniref:hypothetical protein n=1 Tax=Falsiphaeobacter marinintestinus TaxID=1492905 RepID=UPI0011B7E965|nr:hypothetical protein [Phaeobacter marinintestinus]
MKISLEIDADTSEIEALVRMLLLGQISDADVAKAKLRESTYQVAEMNARVSQLFVEACNRNDRKRLLTNKAG